jgi:hypothetical protein
MEQRVPSTPDDSSAPRWLKTNAKTLELPSHVLGAAVEPAAAAPPPAPASPSRTAPEDLRAQPVLRYATVEDAERYRRIMRVLFLEHQAFGLRLRPDQVGERLHGRFGLREGAELLEERLARLAEWGAVDREHDPSLATTAAEWRRNRYTYDVTPAGRLTEGLLAQLDDLGHEHGVLDGQRIPAIRDALNRLAAELETPAPDGAALRALLEQALGQVEALHKGALTFMKALGQLIRRSTGTWSACSWRPPCASRSADGTNRQGVASTRLFRCSRIANPAESRSYSTRCSVTCTRDRTRNCPEGPVSRGKLRFPTRADVAQLARASACHAEGRGFESHHPLREARGPQGIDSGAGGPANRTPS